MWHEIEERKTYTKDGKPQLKITRERALKPGDEVVIFQKTSGLRKKVVSKVSVQIQDRDNATIVAERPQEPTIDAGGFVVFPYRSQEDIAANTFKVTKQDVTIRLGKGKERVRGVRWTDENGAKPEPFVSTPGRSYYEDDTDPETQRMKQDVARVNRQIAEGTIRGGAISS